MPTLLQNCLHGLSSVHVLVICLTFFSIDTARAGESPDRRGGAGSPDIAEESQFDTPCSTAGVADYSTGRDECWKAIPPYILCVPGDCTYVVSGSEFYTYIFILDDGVVQIPGGGELGTAHLSADPDARIEFTGDSGVRPVFKCHYDLTMDGTFETTASGGGEIARHLTYTLTLSSTGRIRSPSGPVLISAPVKNDGVIEANGASASHLIRFTAAPVAASGGKFLVSSSSSAEMRFDHGSAVTITGGADFEIAQGRMIFNESVETNGGARVKGKIATAAGKTFKATGAF